MEANNRERGADEWNPLDEPPKVTWDVARMFYPLRGVDSGLWRSSLQRMQQQFAAASQDAEKLTCVLTQSIVPEWPKRLEGPFPPETMGRRAVSQGSGPLLEPKQLFWRRFHKEQTAISGRQTVVGVTPPKNGWSYLFVNKGKVLVTEDAELEPLVGAHPTYNENGKPFVFSSGEPMGIHPGSKRDYLIYAAKTAAANQFNSIAANAGRTLYGLPANVNRVLWRDWIDGFTTIDDGAMWVNALFELAWQHIPGSSLIARKLAWDGKTSIPLDALPHLRQQAERGAPIAGLDSITDPPAHWYSVIDDLMTASVAAIDILLNIPVETKHDSPETKESECRVEYKWPNDLAEDKWIYENIHSCSFDDLKVEHVTWCQSNGKNKKPLSRNRYKDKADRYGDHHDFPMRRFKGACKCPDCQPVTDT